MLKQLIGFETKYHARQVGFWVTIVIMFLIGFAIMSWPDLNLSASERVKANGAIVVASWIAALSLGSIFFGAIFVVNGIMRDQVHKTLEIIHTTSVSTRNMTLSRMVGVYIATFLCLFALPLGMFVGQFMPWMEPEVLGPINPVFFLFPIAIFIGVNTLIVSGFFTIIAAVTRNRALVYVSAVALLIVMTVAEMFVGQDASDLLTSLSDPFGSAALAITTEFWPADEQNTRMVPLLGYVGLNRLVWGAVGLCLYFASFKLFKRGLVAGKATKNIDVDEGITGRLIIEPVQTHSTFSASLQAFWVRFKYEYLTTVKSVPFIILTLLAVFLFSMTVYVQMVFLPDPALPTSNLVVNTVFNSLAFPLLIIIIFFSGEIIWRDKSVGITEILDASPVKNGTLMAGKWLALIGVVLTLFAVGIVVGMVAQTLLGDIPINVRTYLTLVIGNLTPRFILFCILVLFIQNFMPNRVVGMLASAAAIIFFFIVINFLPFTHPLMRYGAISPGAWSEMNGYSSLIRFKWFGLYWAALAGLFTVISVWLWRRGTQSNLRQRLKSIRRHIAPVSAGLATVFLCGFVGTGAYIYKAYNIDNTFRTSKQSELRFVEFEHLFGEVLYRPVPKIKSVEVDVMFNPSEQTAVIKGKYELENTTGAPVTEVYISKVSCNKNIRVLDLQGAVHVTDGENADAIDDFGYRLFRFEPALAVGATTQLDFETFLPAPRLGRGGSIERNGTFVNNFSTMPQLGVRDSRLVNKDKRRKYDLPEREKRPDRTDLKARENNFFGNTADYVDFKAKVCTDIGQIPIASGEMLRAYDENGKVCRDYEAINPIANFFSFLSADYEVNRDVWTQAGGRDIALAIYYHKAHGYNIDLMTAAMKSSLDTYTKVFGPYQYNQIRIMEFPYGGFAQSFAGTIPFSERIGFVKDPGDPTDNENLDLATYVVMHEIGHQWFGHQIMPANTKGFNVLSEGLTENAAMTAYEAELGWQKARRVLETRSIQQYLTMRTMDSDDEPPLAKAEGQQYLDYNKASWVFWGLKQYMGEDLMQGAIREFLQEYGSTGPAYPTTLQLVEALRAAAPQELQGLITDYWDRITFWELKIGPDMEIKTNSNGGYTVSLNAIVDKRIASEETGKEISVSEIEGESLSEWVEIGFYKNDPKETLGGDWLALKRVHITQAETVLSFDLEEQPSYVLMDPRRLLIERNVKDNVKQFSKDVAALEE